METPYPTLVDEAVGKISDVCTYLQIPTYEDYTAALSQYLADAGAFFRSSYHLAVLTFTPVAIILAYLSKVLWSMAMALGGTAIQQAYAYQKTLSRAAITMECVAVAILIGLYLLRRYIQKHRYVERIKRWFRRNVVTRYQNAVRAVSKTSVLLALALPHLLYASAVTALHFMAPSVSKYLALHTPAIALLTRWVPLFRTILLLHRWTMKKRLDGIESSRSKKDDDDADGSAAGRAAARYLEATMKSPAANNKRRTKQEEEYAALREVGMELLKYWVVYALLCAVFRALSLLPVVGALVTAASPTASSTSQYRWKAPPQPGRMGKMISALRPTEGLLKEVQLLFYVWLLCLPTSLTGAAVDGDVRDELMSPLKQRVSAWAASIGSGDRNRPLNIVYRCFAPIVVSVADFSVQLTQEGRKFGGGIGSGAGGAGDTGGDNTANVVAPARTASSILANLLGKAIGVVRSILQVTVFMKMISPATSDWILMAISDGAALLPAAITLLMPGYFTEFGVLYVSNVVPSANSTVARDNDDGRSMMRYLKYWVIHTLLSSLVASLQPLLAWVPLSTHATWILWAYVQLEPVTTRLHAFLERELILFGLLHSSVAGSDNGQDKQGIDQTMTVKLFRKASSMLPKTPAKSTDVGEGEEKKNEDEAASAEQAAPADNELVRAKID